MKHGYIVLVALVALAIGAPASAQYMWLDVNGDGQCTVDDVLGPSTTSVDVWIDTDSNADGSPATCVTADGDMTINSYGFVLNAPAGGVTYGTWTDNMGFTQPFDNGTAGTEVWVAWASTTPQPAGTYKLGTLNITVTGNNVLQFLPISSTVGTALTAFGAACSGFEFDNTLKYTSEWNDVCGTTAPTPVAETTWGKIKALYR